jgi:hypothetical protein
MRDRHLLPVLGVLLLGAVPSCGVEVDPRDDLPGRHTDEQIDAIADTVAARAEGELVAAGEAWLPTRSPALQSASCRRAGARPRRASSRGRRRALAGDLRRRRPDARVGSRS